MILKRWHKTVGGVSPVARRSAPVGSPSAATPVSPSSSSWSATIVDMEFIRFAQEFVGNFDESCSQLMLECK
jgi:hypothetical protein